MGGGDYFFVLGPGSARHGPGERSREREREIGGREIEEIEK